MADDGCVVCGVGGAARMAPLMIAGLLCDVCHECGPLVASIPGRSWAAVQTCLHLAACEIEREAEEKTEASDAETLRRMGWRFRDGVYRQLCACASCRAVARGERKEPWGEAVDYLTGEVLPDAVGPYDAARSASVREDDSARGVVWRDAQGHDEKEALKRLHQIDTAYPPIQPGSLRARAMVSWRRQDWRRDIAERFCPAPQPAKGSEWSGFSKDGSQKPLSERLAISSRWAALSPHERAEVVKGFDHE